MIDAHQHFWDLGVRDQEWITEAMLPLRRNFGVEDLRAVAPDVTATVLVQTVTVPDETPEFLALAEDSDLVGAVVGWVDLTTPDVGDRIKSYLDGHGGSWLRGIRHQVQGEPDPRWLCRSDVRRGLSAVSDNGLVYELLTLPHQIPAAVETVSALPSTRFVLDHCSKPPIASGQLFPWAEDIRILALNENVSCKLSGLVTEADWTQWTAEELRPYFDVVLEAFGPERLMFGSDWPVCLLAADYPEVVAAARALTASLSAAEQHAIFTASAARTYRIA
ncbi:amidohydrolase family protein [Allokutzneria sp. A3M-2-11 16]|uniref:amidohydrolase family protein n=1 Tax=Allokutzneria sp. A3M-2-11 16 TaxID=2962043 RepID=UPI0020B84A43|nr:amidohydrolase family protein [Allokutzneria sp. A3M-2-11 16]MCP3800023.1 amidohydrolase family protein [Allokutzneria sp. A3M-2-11 16]